ncbi:MAG: SURF1 family cytochrome oxidase biogenesis protein, partial [Pseudomonadota bacterium]
TYPTPPAVVVPKGQVEVTGMLVSPIARFFELGKKMMTNSASNATTATMRATSIQGDVWQNITIERYREHTKRDVLPLVLLANPTAFGLKAQTERPNARVEKHIEYMLTWYCLAAVVVILWLVLNFKFYRQPA